MLEIIKVIDRKPSPSLGQIWVRGESIFFITCVSEGFLWTYKLSEGEVTEYAIDRQNSWRFKLFAGDSSARDEVIDKIVDALYEQDDIESANRIYEIEKLNQISASI